MFDVVEVVERRHDLLDALAAAEREQPELVDALDASKSTVYRGLKDLQQHDLVAYADGGYTLTTTGELVLQQYDAFVEDVRATVRAGDLLARLPRPSEVDIDPAFLRGATVETGAPPDQAAPADRVEDLLDRTTRFRGLVRARTQSDAGAIYRRRVADGMIASYVVESEMLTFMREAADFDDHLDHERVTAYEVDSLPFGLFLLDTGETTHAALLVYDGQKRLRGVIVNDAEPAVAWAERVYERFERRATPVEG